MSRCLDLNPWFFLLVLWPLASNSLPQFLHLLSGDGNNTYFIGVSVLNELIVIQHMGQCLTHSRCAIIAIIMISNMQSHSLESSEPYIKCVIAWHTSLWNYSRFLGIFSFQKYFQAVMFRWLIYIIGTETRKGEFRFTYSKSVIPLGP